MFAIQITIFFNVAVYNAIVDNGFIYLTINIDSVRQLNTQNKIKIAQYYCFNWMKGLLE